MKALHDANHKLNRVVKKISNDKKCMSSLKVGIDENELMRSRWISEELLTRQVEMYESALVKHLTEQIETMEKEIFDGQEGTEEQEKRNLNFKIQQLQSDIVKMNEERVSVTKHVSELKKMLEEKELEYKEAMLSKMREGDDSQPVPAAAPSLDCIISEQERLKRQLELLSSCNAKALPENLDPEAAATCEIQETLEELEALQQQHKKVLAELSNTETERLNRLGNVARACATRFDPGTISTHISKWHQCMKDSCMHESEEASTLFNETVMKLQETQSQDEIAQYNNLGLRM